MLDAFGAENHRVVDFALFQIKVREPGEKQGFGIIPETGLEVFQNVFFFHGSGTAFCMGTSLIDKFIKMCGQSQPLFKESRPRNAGHYQFETILLMMSVVSLSTASVIPASRSVL